MAEVFSGFICGFILALITTPLFALWLLRWREAVPFIARAMPEGVSPLLISVPLANILFLLWTGLGIVLGMVLILADRKTSQGALGSPNILFTVIVLLATVIIFLPPFLLLRRARRPVALLAVSFLLLFGWLTPYMAQWASTD
jgi:hypothetical protein